MDAMGYKNADRVYRLAAQGRVRKVRDGRMKLDPMALNLLVYMALHCVNKEDAKAVRQGNPYWCYWGGWKQVMDDFGMAVPDLPNDVSLEDGASDEAVGATAKRVRTATNQLSTAAKSLEGQGLIKELKGPAPIAGKNKVWLLLLGDTPEENVEAERVARRAFGLPPVE